MERIDLSKLYNLGADLHPIGDFPDKETPAHVVFPALLSSQAAIALLLGPDAPVRIEISRPAAVELRKAIDSLYNGIFIDKEGRFSFPSNETVVYPYQFYYIKEAIRTFEAVFRAEMQVSATYKVPKKGIYDTGYLVDKSSDAFPENLFPYIAKMALSEYMEAGRCYAFGLYTASGYHSCRAAEAVLREYYTFFTGKTDSGEENWGRLINDLAGISNGKKPSPDDVPLAPVRTIDQIRHLKDHSRNPLSHLRSVLDEKDADELLSRAKVVIMAMASDIMEKKEAIEPVLQLDPPDGTAT